MKFIIYNLGCKVNSYESNLMTEILEKEGFVLTNDVNLADIAIVNTCTVTNTADNKSLKTLRQIRRSNPGVILIATGCLAQVDREAIKEKADVDIVIGNVGKSKIGEIIKEYLNTQNKIVDIKDIMTCPFEDMQINNFDKTRAFVKIQDGCNNYCSYCIIPYARGNVRSKKPENVINEIKELIKNGHQEIVLAGIHTGHYGSEFKDYDFSDLLNDILKLNGLKRLRISSIEIVELTDKFLNILENNKVLVDHLHIPLQAGSNEILKLMNRRYDLKLFEEKIAKIRKIRPEISISTDVIVGFPHETEELFKETIETVKRIDFSKIHVFPYSRRKGTKADLMDNQIDERIKKERSRTLVQVSKELEIKYMEKFLNREVEFIPETYHEGFIFGHTGNYLSIKTNGTINDLNKSKGVKITKIEYPYCIAE